MKNNLDEFRFPILRFDPAPEAVIEVSKHIPRLDVPAHSVICFFAEVIKKVVLEKQARIIYVSHSEMGEHPIYEMAYKGQRIAFYHPGVGAPLAVGLTEEVIAIGVENFIACGGCGVLDKEIALGHILLPEAAYRDEGTSYHYVEPSEMIHVEPGILAVMESTLNKHHIPYLRTKTWTTDAIYRETPAKVLRYKEAGCLAVEMEAASLIALAKFRGVKFGQYLYSGDAVVLEGWDSRSWKSRQEIRESLFWLSVETCLNLSSIQ